MYIPIFSYLQNCGINAFLRVLFEFLLTEYFGSTFFHTGTSVI